MFVLIQSENHASKKGKMAGRYQFYTHPTRIGLNCMVFLVIILIYLTITFALETNRHIFMKIIQDQKHLTI